LGATLQIPVRYWAMHASTPQEMIEANVHYMTPVWDIDTAETALVLVDCWDTNAWKSHSERSGEIIANKIAPLVEVLRTVGVKIVHAPAPLAAWKYPQCSRYAADEDFYPTKPTHDNWPPEEFRQRAGQYGQYALAPPTTLPDLSEAEDIADPIKPEPEDMVIATGAQLHRLLKHHGILHLLYCGFATNSCVILRDYGIYAMQGQGYNAIFVRDCTTAIENSTTIADAAMTAYAIKDIERGTASTTSQELIKTSSPEKA
jgi:nicotinamidase-related amidase